MSKEKLKKALSKLKKEELIEMLLAEQPAKKKRRRGKGGRKKHFRNKVSPPQKGSNDFDHQMQTIKLTSSEKEELKLASQMDAETKPSPRSSRRRSTAIEVSCRVCGSQESVSQAIVYDISRWKCNKCAASAG